MLDVSGRSDVARIAAELKAIHSRVIRTEVTKALTAVGQPLIRAAQQSARENLPKTGGLNEWFANAEFTVKIRGGKNPTLQARGSKTGHDLRTIDQGHVRHPVYGHKDRKWAWTEVEPGVFTNAMLRTADQRFVDELIRAADRVIAAMTAGSGG